MAKLLTPLAPNVPIVDEDGNPTPYFARIMAELTDARISATVLESLGGDPDADDVLTWDNTNDDLAFRSPSEVLDLIGQGAQAHGDILYRDSAAWALLPAGTDGDVLTTHGASADPTWETPSVGGGGGAWALHGSTTIGAATATVPFTGLAGATDVMLICHGITMSASDVPIVQVSIDNGSTYYTTSGDYIRIAAAGTVTNSTNICSLWSATATAARTGTAILCGLNVTGTPRFGMSYPNTATPSGLFLADTANDIDAVRLIGNGGANFTGGTVYCLSR